MIKVGVVGMGMGGSYGAKLHAIEGVEFSAMCARTQTTLDRRSKLYKEEIGAEPNQYLSVDDMLANETLDGVIIVTPSSTHHEIVVKVANAGINVLIDKPIDINQKNIEIIREAVDRNNVLCGVIYPNRCNSVFSGLKKIVSENLLGKPLLCDVRLKFFRDQAYYDKGGWKGTWEFDGGGSLMNQGAHPIDILCWTFGKPKSIFGSFAALNHNIETEDWASGVIEFESGVRSAITTTTCVAPKTDKQLFDFHAQEGSVYIENGKVLESSYDDILELEPCKFEHPVNDFADAIINNRPPMVSIEEASWSVNIIEGFYKSSKEGKLIYL
ncbi:MAG: hypothetical protein COA79_25255 [Planctomycetota bacterium]|nr:MAG: hypothetical protein COA79_25255 [Planctomycetota bacterium]